MFVVYILYSQKLKKHYIGYTSDIENRINLHNSAKVKSTKNGIPWELKYIEEFDNRNDAYRRELQIKGYKGGVAFKSLFN